MKPTTINFELSTQHQHAPPFDTSTLPDEFQNQWALSPNDINHPSVPIPEISTETVSNSTTETVIGQPE